MRASIVLDEETVSELDELKLAAEKSKSELVREAVRDLYLKEKRAQGHFLFFADMYRRGIITKDMLFLLLPRRDAENIMIGAEVRKHAAKRISR